MIKPYEITIGSLLKTNKGEIIKVESISTKRKHRKVGYHEEGDPYHIKYVRLVQCESIPLSDEFLVSNKFELDEDKAEWKRHFGKYEICYLDKGALTIDDKTDESSFRLVQDVFTVHRLQAALIYCGLQDLALNLNVQQ
jgi:hypothetical protein